MEERSYFSSCDGHEAEVPGSFHNMVHKREVTSSILTHFKNIDFVTFD